MTDFFVVDRQHPEPGAGLAVLRSVDLPGRHQELSLGGKATTTSSSAPVRRAACSPTGCRRTRPAACCCWRRAAATAISGSSCRSATSAPSTTRASRGCFRTEPSEGHGGAQHRLAARPRARRLELDQRPDLHPRPARGLRRLGAGRRRGLGLPRRAAPLPQARNLRRRRRASTAARTGELGVSDLRNDHPACRAWVDAGAQLGLPANADFNGETTYGVGAYQLSIGKRWRESAAVAFLRPALARPNLTRDHGGPCRRASRSRAARAVGVEWVATAGQTPRARSAR